jgi:hypothetical protein
VFLVKGKNAIIEHVRRDQRVLAVIQFGERHLGIGVDESLLVNGPMLLMVPT